MKWKNVLKIFQKNLVESLNKGVLKGDNYE